MREIKFRAWDKKEKTMVNDEYWLLASNGKIYEYSMGKLSKSDNYDLMQYTGLKDKNGKEIYEGDIVKGFEDVDLDTGIGIDSHEVETNTFVIEWDEHMTGWNLYGATKFEVIGNIYENPELLKEE